MSKIPPIVLTFLKPAAVNAFTDYFISIFGTSISARPCFTSENTNRVGGID